MLCLDESLMLCLDESLMLCLDESLMLYLDESLMLCLDESLMQCASPAGRRCNTAQKSPIRRKTIATLLRKKSSPARRAKAPLAIPKLWRSYSVASYIPRPYGRGVGLGYWGKDPPLRKRGTGVSKNPQLKLKTIQWKLEIGKKEFYQEKIKIIKKNLL